MTDSDSTSEYSPADPSVEVAWIGHSTALIEAGGHRVMTDPLLTRRVAHLRRRRSLPAPDVEEVDMVVLSHAHMDHLHLPSLKRFGPGTKFITPRGSGVLLRKAGFTEVTEVEVGDQIESGPVVVEAVRAAHKSGRGPHSRVEAQPIGYVVETYGTRVYFAGDTDLFEGMADLSDIDVALLPIWGWGQSIGNGHLDPARAVEATGLIRPRIVVPIHWGTYAPEDGRRRLPRWFEEPGELFEDELSRSHSWTRLELLEPAESISVSSELGD